MTCPRLTYSWLLICRPITRPGSWSVCPLTFMRSFADWFTAKKKTINHQKLNALQVKVFESAWQQRLKQGALPGNCLRYTWSVPKPNCSQRSRLHSDCIVVLLDMYGRQLVDRLLKSRSAKCDSRSIWVYRGFRLLGKTTEPILLFTRTLPSLRNI